MFTKLYISLGLLALSCMECIVGRVLAGSFTTSRLLVEHVEDKIFDEEATWADVSVTFFRNSMLKLNCFLLAPTALPSRFDSWLVKVVDEEVEVLLAS